MMQTRVPVSTEANKQLSHSAQPATQLLAEKQSSFEDHSPHAAQLTSQQAMMSDSPSQQRMQAMQAKMNGSAQAHQMRTGQASMAGGDVAQCEKVKEPLQAQVDGGEVQREEVATASEAPKPNNTGLPDNLKSGIESLSGMSMDHVKVHYNSSQPAQLNAHAYAQGSEIHVAPGQEQHVPHEAWHVVQQAQGRVKPTMQMKMGVPVNDDVGLESEADVMGAKAIDISAAHKSDLTYSDSAQSTQLSVSIPSYFNHRPQANALAPAQLAVIQRNTEITYRSGTQFDYYSSPALRAAGAGFDQNGIVGEHMEALLDLNDPKQGSGVGAGHAKRGAHAASQVHPTAFVSGHLLNGGLGGLGIDTNMVPITAAANALHSGIEQNVKHLLAGAPMAAALGPGLGHVRYQVDVEGPGGGAVGPILDEAAPDCDLHVTVQNLMLPGLPVTIDQRIQSRTPAVQLPAAWDQLGTGHRSPATGGAIITVAAAGGTVTAPVTGIGTPVGPLVLGAKYNSVTGQLMALLE